ncbi:MAG: polysaccharide pyruvyl transferase family protein [Phormidesmis sp. RL_2_1]|nr:polysaccharide pyruvyl transferase family protein [Phormidesmis sp. RL_2_1]
MKICLLDPGLQQHSGELSANLGDLIIQESVKRELTSLFPEHEIIQLSTHAPLGKEELAVINQCSLVFVGGSNLLSSYMDKYKQWDISLWDAVKIRKAILLGAGWWEYQGELNRYTKALLKILMSRGMLHSVRDGYTQAKLQSISVKGFPVGIQNVLNTGCPTMWPLMNMNLAEFSTQKAENALLMLTDYRKVPELDRQLLELLFEKYENVYFWWQGRGDEAYIRELDFPVKLIEHSLPALDAFIHSGISFDYIGTRLHGGIRCLQSNQRSLVIEVDNRAKEIAQDTNLQTAARDDFNYIRQWIDGSPVPQIKLNSEAINQWRGQFESLAKVA